MKYRKMPGLDKEGSVLVYGTYNATFIHGKNADDLLDELVKDGINVIDTARVYLQSEKVLGKWMAKRNSRKDLIIISKCAHPSFFCAHRLNEKDIRRDLAKSLHFLKTDYIDIYLMHRDNPEVPAEKIVPLFNQLISEGKIRAYGCSNWSLSRIKEINDYALEHGLIPMQYSSPNYSLAENVHEVWKGCTSLQGEKHKEERDYYEKTGMTVLAYSSLAMGFFSGKLKSSEKDTANEKLSRPAVKGFACESNFARLERAEKLAEKKNTSVADIALAYLLNQKMTVFPIVTTQSPERIAGNAAASEIILTEEECAYLNLESEME